MAGSQSLDPAPTVIKSAEFFNIELAPLTDGRVYVSMTATTVDDQEAQLLTQEIVRTTVATIDDALAVIKEGLTNPL
jgi:hypothetical protein